MQFSMISHSWFSACGLVSSEKATLMQASKGIRNKVLMTLFDLFRLLISFKCRRKKSSSLLYSKSIKDSYSLCLHCKYVKMHNYSQFKGSCTANQPEFKSSFAKIKVNNEELSAIHPFDFEFFTLKNIFISSAIDYQTSGD